MGSCFSGGSNDEEREPLLFASVEHEQQKISVKCVDDPEPMKPMVHYEDETVPMYHHPPGSCLSRIREHLFSASGEQEKEKLSLQCVDDPTPLDAIVYYGDKAFPMHHHPPVEVGEDV